MNGRDASVAAPVAAGSERRAPKPVPAAAQPHPSSTRQAPWVGAEPPAGQVVAAATGVLLLAALIEIAVADAIGPLFGLCLVAVSLGAALLVRPRDLFIAGVLPPLLLVGVLTAIAVLHGEGIQVARLDASSGVAQRVIAGFVHLAGALVVAHASALIIVALRGRVGRRRRRDAAGSAVSRSPRP